jgi:methyl-accepting chemotaxis protein
MRLRDISMRKRLGMAFGIFVLLIAALVVTGVIGAHALNDGYSRLVQADTAGLANMAAYYHEMVTFLIGIGLFSAALAVFITIKLSSSIVTNIGKGVAVARMLAEGRLDFNIEVDRKDEFGDEAAAIKVFLGKWRDIVGDVKKASDSVASAGLQLTASAGQMWKGASEQAERAQQVATASEEMSQTVNDTARSAENMSSVASQTAAMAQSGGKTVAEAVREVEEIASTVNESADHITSLSKLSQKIGDIIGIINEIADQTNLLALNAAIEAARAGEHGRGFAVVADEVRKLAERTTAATSEVGSIIQEIQTNVTSAVSSIDQVSAKVERGVDLSNKAGTELHHIVKSVEDLQAMVQQIAVSLDEMTATSDHISRDIDTISGISRDTSRSSDEVLRASNELTRLGNDLQNVAGQFRV